MRWLPVVNFNSFGGSRPRSGSCLIDTTHGRTRKLCHGRLSGVSASFLIVEHLLFLHLSSPKRRTVVRPVNGVDDGVVAYSCADGAAASLRIDSRMDTSDASSDGKSRPCPDTCAFHD